MSLFLEKERVTRQGAKRRVEVAPASMSKFAYDKSLSVEDGPSHGTQHGKGDPSDGENHLDEKKSSAAREHSPAFVLEDPTNVPVSRERRPVISPYASSHMERTVQEASSGRNKRKREEVEETGRELDAPPVKVRRSARVRRIPTRYDP